MIGYCFVEFLRKFSDKSVSKSDFMKIINLHHHVREKIYPFFDQSESSIQKSLV